jgi:hypothetical protein
VGPVALSQSVNCDRRFFAINQPNPVATPPELAHVFIGPDNPVAVSRKARDSVPNEPYPLGDIEKFPIYTL